MNTATLRTGISKMLQKVEDEHFLKAVYAMVKEYNEAEGADFELTVMHKDILDEREAARKSGHSKSYSWTAAKRAIREKPLRHES